MKTTIKILLVLGVLGALGAVGSHFGQRWLAERNKPRFRTAKLETGDIRVVVNASGELNPTLKVKIGSFVSGPILKLHVDYNTEVTEGQLLAEIDPRIYVASVDRDKAALLTREADVLRVQAELQRARNDEKRAEALKIENPDFIAQSELDQFHFSRLGLEAQLQVAQAGVKQAAANLQNSEANVEYTKITSPVDGVVVDRRIDPGQTLAAQFQTPELFIIAPGMKEKMLILASIDEADIGRIKAAQDRKQAVFFTVDAYPDEIFKEGFIEQVRLSPMVNQQVVTYPVIVATPNPELKLLPGMTANLTFVVDEFKEVLKIPNSALRYYPDKALVRDSDQKVLELNVAAEPEDDDAATSSQEPPVDDAAAAAVAAMKRIVWVQETEADAAETRRAPANATGEGGANAPAPAAPAADGAATSAVKLTGKLKAVEITIGDSDYRFTRVLSGPLTDGAEVVTGVKPPGTP